MKNHTSKLIGGLFSLLLLISPLVVYSQRQDIYDWWRLRNYEPSARVVQLSQATTMNDLGRHLFYVHHPQLDDKAAFSQHCQGAEQSIILGCYVTNRKIYIFDVPDERLQGVHEVTAAHEMLHAAYDRLNDDERNKIDASLQQFLNGLSDARIKKTVESYRTKDPGIVPNELHSIIGTEVRQLPPDLEAYYERYFNDRLKIVAFSEQYEQVFTERENKVAAYDSQLGDLKQRIETAQSELETLSANINSERDRLDQLLASGRSDAYNNAVSGFNQQIRNYNSMITSTKQLIDQHNKIVTERNAVALEEQELAKALDSRISPQSEE